MHNNWILVEAEIRAINKQNEQKYVDELEIDFYSCLYNAFKREVKLNCYQIGYIDEFLHNYIQYEGIGTNEALKRGLSIDKLLLELRELSKNVTQCEEE